MTPLRVLLVDDNDEVHQIVGVAVERANVELHSATSAEEALSRLAAIAPDLILLDLVLPGMNGCEALRVMKERGVDVPVIVITSHASLEAAVEAVEGGAVDVLTKPLRLRPLMELLDRYRTEPRTTSGGTIAPSDSSPAGQEAVLVGKSPQMVAVYKAIARVAETSATVLIEGESGTGKELVARAIHRYSRRTGPFVAVNCAAIPETLLESELFGHEKGAFTGASSTKRGKLERAHTGTFLLDEVGDMPLSLQAKILRVLDERRVEHVGGSQSVSVNVRMISATHRDLRSQVRLGAFREDLFYRLAVVAIRVPPLREREGDIHMLVDHYVRTLAPRARRAITAVHPEVYERLARYSWPGNVRELRNVLERSMILSRGSVLDPSALPDMEEPESVSHPFEQLVTEQRHLADVERGYIARVLGVAGWNQSEAARRLGIHRNTLRRKIREYGLSQTAA
jgi:two-component system, NtrC family, response regulator AtoC